MEIEGLLIRYTHQQGTWQEYQPSSAVVILGRAPDCSIVLDAKNISRQHARIEFTAQAVLLTDLGSMNGTQMNGVPLQPRKPVTLAPGQSFTLGAFTVQWVQKHAPSATPASNEINRASAQSFNNPLPLEPELLDDVLKTAFKSSEEIQPVAAPYSLDLSVETTISIGRADDNMVVLEHPMVSRYHAEIDRVGMRVQIRDLSSTNGVFVNNERISHEVWLKNDDHIQVGPYIFTLSGHSLRRHTDTGLTLETKLVNKHVSAKLNLLKNITLRIKPAEFVAVVGMSGSGKTTLLNVLSGYSPATAGNVLVNGADLYKHYDTFRNDMGYVPQKDIVHAELTPFSALMYVARLRMPADTSDQERNQAVLEVLEELMLTERKDVPIARLSGGQLKRVSIGVELLTRPRLFFLDEPTSGLDPGTEYEMMHLLRHLADQGRTVILVTHATKNVILCDKVIFLARGGYLVFFGAPDEALTYFDKFRTPRERLQKVMEFDDIYRILSDEKRGAPAEWNARFLATPQYKTAIGHSADSSSESSSKDFSRSEHKAISKKRPPVSAFQQFLILSQRNLKILWSDKVSIVLMLALAPAIGLLDFIWGNQLYDPVKGDAGKIISMWFMTAIITVMVGAMASVREIVKEADIYRRERVVNLMLMPYILSKVWVGVALALYQAGVLMLTQVVLNHPTLPDTSTYLALYFTLFLSTLCGYMLGLTISASAPNQNAAMLLIIAVLVPQFLFSGALLPLDSIPGGEIISSIMPTRWTFESFINMSAIGDTLIHDACWALPTTERKALTTDQKKDCTCLGTNIFHTCDSFPGIRSVKFYNTSTAEIIEKPAPLEPIMPTAFPYPTAVASPTPLPTPTRLPSPTPLATPLNPQNFQKYMDDSRTQGNRYQDTIQKQLDKYRSDSEQQAQSYGDQRTQQGDEYSDLRQQQADDYKAQMNQYVDDRSSYEEARQKAISSAESVLENMYDNFGRTFKGTLPERWVNLAVIMASLLVLLTIFQKRKDVI